MLSRFTPERHYIDDAMPPMLMHTLRAAPMPPAARAADADALIAAAPMMMLTLR